MEDRHIIDLYWARDERAVEESKQSYGTYCFSIAQAILHNQWDTEEIVSETWMQAWNSIPPKKPKYLRQYLAKITRNLALNAYTARNTQKRKEDQVALALEELEECVASSGDVGENLAYQELRNAIMSFLQEESRQSRNVFLRRYFYFDEVAQIATRYSLTESNVLQILSRTRKRLKKYLRKEGYAL